MDLTPSRQTDHAIRILVVLAEEGERSTTATEVANRLHIAVSVSRQVLQALVRGRLISSRPGANGGFRLARTPSDITIRSIIEAIEGPVLTQECILSDGPCHWQDVCALHRVWMAAQAQFARALDEASLADVIADDVALQLGLMVVPEDSHRRNKTRPPR